MTLDNYNIFNDDYLTLPFNMPLSPLPKLLVSAEGIGHTGAPTLTTQTLTPTTLQSIEESFIQLTSESPINAPSFQAGFVPPPFQSISTNATNSVFNGSIHDLHNLNESDSDENSQNSLGNPYDYNEDNSVADTDTSSAATDSTSFQNGLNSLGGVSLTTSNLSSTNDFTAVIAAAAASGALITSNSSNNNKHNNNTSNTTTTRRNQGGRRPTKSTNSTPEEEEKRRIRRERNKLAAARCRKRRVDQTNELEDEVAHLQKKRDLLQKELENLNSDKQQLEYILEAHRPTCQKIRQDFLTVNTYGGLIAPTNNNSNDSNGTITGIDTTLASTGRSASPIDLKPVVLDESMLDIVPHIKNEPLENLHDSNSSLGHEHPMIPPPLPNVATLSASLAAASASLNTPIVTTAPVSFSTFGGINNATLNSLNALNKLTNSSKQRPNSLPTMPRNLAANLALNVDGKAPTAINGVAIQTPSTGMFNFDSLMEGGTGLTPVSGPLIPTCSSQNKHPLELTTPTSDPSKLVSL